MTSAKVVKWLAGFGLFGALLMFVMFILRLSFPESALGAYFDLFSTLLLIFVILAVYLTHMKSSGNWGLISFAIGIIGTSLWVGVKWVHAIIVPALAIHAPSFVEEPPSAIMAGQMGSFAVFMLGWVLIGILIAKKGYLSR